MTEKRTYRWMIREEISMDREDGKGGRISLHMRRYQRKRVQS